MTNLRCDDTLAQARAQTDSHRPCLQVGRRGSKRAALDIGTASEVQNKQENGKCKQENGKLKCEMEAGRMALVGHRRVLSMETIFVYIYYDHYYSY